MSLHDIILQTKLKTDDGNVDNISRTERYAKFYKKHPEVKWALLASMVSRNAGWFMTDLEGIPLKQALPYEKRQWLFLSVETANWLIFADAYPQLLLYEYSKRHNKPMFYLLEAFHVSAFMMEEWERFFRTKDEKRLLTSLIINEQHVIQKPVIDHPLFKKFVFHSLPFIFQDLFHFRVILFPTITGKLYGFSTHQFSHVKKRIELGKRLAWLLFHPLYHGQFLKFSNRVIHTGSRYDYEKYMKKTTKRKSPFLRTAFPIISHEIDEKEREWFHGQRLGKYYKDPEIPKRIELTDWYEKKQSQLHLLCMMKQYLQ